MPSHERDIWMTSTEFNFENVELGYESLKFSFTVELSKCYEQLNVDFLFLVFLGVAL